MVWDFDYTSVNSIKTLLNGSGLYMNRKFGQNFLINRNALNRIMSEAQVKAGMKVWEVGPGIGALTTRLVNAGADVKAFEIDRGFCAILKEKVFVNEKNFTLIEGDVLKNWESEYRNNGAPDLVCANLPYNIGSVFIARLIEERCLPPRMVFTLQKEVVRRMCGEVGSELYGSFSILTSLDYANREAFLLKSTSFWPAPDVDSAVIVMEKREKRIVNEDDVKKYIDFLHVVFSARRKTLLNNLKAGGYSAERVERALEKNMMNPAVRAEALSAGELYSLMKTLCE